MSLAKAEGRSAAPFVKIERLIGKAGDVSEGRSAMIWSMRTVLCRTMLGVLDDRGIRLHTVAWWCRIPIIDLRGLAESGAPLDAAAAERLIGFGTRMVDISAIVRDASQNRTGDERNGTQASIAGIVAAMSSPSARHQRSP